MRLACGSRPPPTLDQSRVGSGTGSAGSGIRNDRPQVSVRRYLPITCTHGALEALHERGGASAVVHSSTCMCPCPFQACVYTCTLCMRCVFTVDYVLQIHYNLTTNGSTGYVYLRRWCRSSYQLPHHLDLYHTSTCNVGSGGVVLTPSRSRRFQLLSSRQSRLKTFAKRIFS